MRRIDSTQLQKIIEQFQRQIIRIRILRYSNDNINQARNNEDPVRKRQKTTAGENRAVTNRKYVRLF